MRAGGLGYVLLAACLTGCGAAEQNDSTPSTPAAVQADLTASQAQAPVLAAAWARHEGLAVQPGVHLVIGHCTACHSAELITAQRGDRAFWKKTIRWMQNTQNLWVLPPAHETAVLDYLAAHYAETEWGRRPALPPELMPDS